jgi:hypothetical protein
VNKKAKAVAALPLVSPHWWTREKTVIYSRAHAGELADAALTAAVNAGDLPVKFEWIDHETSPPVPCRRLLSAEDYAFGPYISNNFLVVQPRRSDVSPLPRPHALFFWGPKAKELWPTEEAEPRTGAQHRRKPQSQPAPKLSGKQWVPIARKRWSDELRGMTITEASRVLAEKSETAPDCAKPLKADYIENELRRLHIWPKKPRGYRQPPK